MQTVIIGVFLFFILVFAMIIASYLNGKPMSGSCGGVAKLFGLDSCVFCKKKRAGECPATK